MSTIFVTSTYNKKKPGQNNTAYISKGALLQVMFYIYLSLSCRPELIPALAMCPTKK